MCTKPVFWRKEMFHPLQGSDDEHTPINCGWRINHTAMEDPLIFISSVLCVSRWTKRIEIVQKHHPPYNQQLNTTLLCLWWSVCQKNNIISSSISVKKKLFNSRHPVAGKFQTIKISHNIPIPPFQAIPLTDWLTDWHAPRTKYADNACHHSLYEKDGMDWIQLSVNNCRAS